MLILLMTILLNFINLSATNQLSAYDDDWNDMSAFREDIKNMGIETRSLVSSPLLLADIEDPRNTTYVRGVERDTFHCLSLTMMGSSPSLQGQDTS